VCFHLVVRAMSAWCNIAVHQCGDGGWDVGVRREGKVGYGCGLRAPRDATRGEGERTR
jgi:hypothetical protein